MPITPRFLLSQTETHINLKIHTPHIRVTASSIEAVIDGPEFHFYTSPYLLHLTFPGNLLDDFESEKEAKAIFDPSNNNGTVTIDIWKEEEGIWKDLDLIGRLVSQNHHKKSNVGKPLITIVSSTSNTISDADVDGIDVANEHIDGDSDEISHLQTQVDEDLLCINKPRYGFLDMFHSIFTAFAKDGILQEMVEIPNPDDEHVDQTRRENRIQMENDKFDPDRYMDDWNLSPSADDENTDMVYSEAIRMIPHYWLNDTNSSPTTIEPSLCDEFQKLTTDDSSPRCETSTDREHNSFFNQDELLILSTLKTSIPPLEHINATQTRSLSLSLLDILYAYCYDHRTTLGDPSCESWWTITFLSPTLSWFEKYSPPYDSSVHVLRWCIRRALIYPYLRNYNFCSHVLLQDMIRVLSQGRRTVIRCLIQLHDIFDKSEFSYLHNKLYIDPFISWIQRLDGDELMHALGEEIQTICLSDSLLSKDLLDLNLCEIERNYQLLEEDDVDEAEDNLTEEEDIGKR
jgi:protein SHQ1